MRASISTKLLAITVGVISLAVALAGGVLLRQHRRELQRGFEDGTVVLARAIAEHCVGPMAFEDRRGAQEILAKLERSTVVGRAVLYDRRGRVLAAYDRLDQAAPTLPLRTAPTVVHQDGYLHVFEPVLHKEELQGTLYLTASNASQRARAWTATLMIVLVGLAAIAAAAVLAWVLQRTVTRPILRLAETMRGITGETMLSTRVEHRRTDEIGLLHAGFNRMLDQLASRQHERDRSDARLRALIAALPDPVFVLEESGRIVEVLAGRPELLSVPAEGLRDKRIAEVIAPENHKQLDEAIAQAVSSQAPRRLAYELELPAGKRCFDAMIVPIVGDPGDQGRFVLFVPRDITERQTLELDLRQAQKMDALGRLAGGVAHDFNNLLTAIMGYASLLQRILERETQSTVEVEEILKAGQRAALLTQQLLAFSRRQVVQMRPVALNDLVRDMQRMLERIIGEDVQLVAELAPPLSPVQGDPGQLQQVILNLAVNAREAMPGGGTLTLRTLPVAVNNRRAGEPKLPPGRYVLLEVTDTGVGMDESTRGRIFEPFFTTKGRAGGTGLGLAMVYGIVRQSGGDVSVISEPSRGTTFRIYLPEASPSASVAEPLVPPKEDLPPGNETILVVEDQEQLKELTCRILRDQGYQVMGTTDARKALEICTTHPGPIHLLVTDMVMPRMSGAELVHSARPLRSEMRVLYMSGYAGSAALTAAAEAVPFLQKPFTAHELGRRVRDALTPLSTAEGLYGNKPLRVVGGIEASSARGSALAPSILLLVLVLVLVLVLGAHVGPRILGSGSRGRVRVRVRVRVRAGSEGRILGFGSRGRVRVRVRAGSEGRILGSGSLSMRSGSWRAWASHCRAGAAGDVGGAPAGRRSVGLCAGPGLALLAGMVRLFLALALLASGCMTGGDPFCHRRPDRFEMVAGLVLGGLALAADLAEQQPAPPPPPPAPTARPLFGTVHWEGSGQRVPRVMVTLRGTSDFVVLHATTDDGGRFWFPMPLPADWYRLSVEDPSAEGETKLWLKDRRPAILDLAVRPRATGVPASD